MCGQVVPHDNVTLSILRKPHNLRVLLELPEHLLAQGTGDLRVDAGVLDVLVAQVISDILAPTAGFQEMYRHRVAQGVNRSLLDTGSVSIIVEQLLDLALLQGTLAAGEEVGPDVSAFTQIAAHQFGRMPPQRLFST